MRSLHAMLGSGFGARSRILESLYGDVLGSFSDHNIIGVASCRMAQL